MTPLKSAIFREVRLVHENCEDDDALNKAMFKHIDGLRLTLSGFMILRKIFTVYSFEIPITLKARHQIGIARMEYPYFLTERRLVLFSEMDAMVIKLHGGIEGFLENCFRIGR